MSLMTRGRSFHSRLLAVADGRSVSHRRGNGNPTSLTSTVPKRVPYAVLDAEGQQTEIELWDWIIPVSDLGSEPIVGDLFEETVNGVTRTFEVCTPQGKAKCSEWYDAGQTRWLVHTQVVEVEEE